MMMPCGARICSVMHLYGKAPRRPHCNLNVAGAAGRRRDLYAQTMNVQYDRSARLHHEADAVAFLRAQNSGFFS